MTWAGDFPSTFTAVPIFFTTHAAAGGTTAPLSAFEAGDVLLYKDGDAAQRTSTSGWTMTSPFDSITGLHRLLIDLTDNTHAGFYAAGHVYTAILTPDTETVDGQTVAKVIGQFGIDLAGTFARLGAPAGASVSADIAAVKAVDDAIKAKTDNLPSDPADESLIIAATDAITAAIAALNNLSAAQVNAEVLDVLNVDTFVQPGQSTPAATTTIRLMLAWLYKAYRNRSTQTATQYSLYNDDAVTVDQKATTSDDAVTTDRGEVATGP